MTVFTIEANMNSVYGGGFRSCVASLRGRKLHELLSHVRQHGRLPPPLALAQSGLGFEGLG